MFSPTAEEFTPIAHSLGMYHLSGDHGSSGQAGGGGIQVGSTRSAVSKMSQMETVVSELLCYVRLTHPS